MAKRRPQGDGTIRKRIDGRWEARIIVGHKNDGSPMYKSAFAKTQKSALKELHHLIELYRDVDLTEDCRMTLGEWLDKWLDEYMIFTIRESTLDSYRAMVKNQVKPFIGGKQIASLTTADMQKFYNKIKKEGRVREHPIHGKTLADSMVRGVHMMLHGAFDVAVRERLLVKNPTNGTIVPKCNYPKKQILGDSQLETFLEAINGHEYWCDFFYVEVMTGLRRGEICGLKWQDINFEENKLQVKRSVSVKKGSGVSIGETKTETGVRSILMPPSVAEVLQNRKQRAITEWVFPNFMYPEQPISPATAYRKLKIILKHDGLPLIRFHDLRHTFATHATHGGVDPKTLVGILGHTNASFTLDTYTHVTSDMQKAASNIVGNIMQNIMIKE
ncbi:site-specific recombinase phage integrase family [Candidatus Colimorpha enterica]|uniref:Site-specific recombinase phage integrase family n=1 Tax=Candidatus Colimorpha enterica TaxID=3083063 RepID=R6UPQ9_9BACT|nr:site-specific recombinase phage integrase family [Candidatus Colimorpha enterica]